MKIKNIATICKKQKSIYIFKPDDGSSLQYIGNGIASYPVSGLPPLDRESILTIFDVPEKQREDWNVQIQDLPSGIDFRDFDDLEQLVERDSISIIYSGKTLKPLYTSSGLMLIESGYLSPLVDVLDILELFERVTPSGTPYIVAKAGMLLQGVIMPTIVNEEISDKLSYLAGESRRALFSKAESTETEPYEQTTI